MAIGKTVQAAVAWADSRGQSASLSLIVPVIDRIARFPTTRYYGSKRKLLRWMYGHFGTLRFDTVLDAFGGSGSVSLLFQAMNKSVTYHDGFRFNEDVARTVLSPKPALTVLARVADGIRHRLVEQSETIERIPRCRVGVG